jgi:hypothetical protein
MKRKIKIKKIIINSYYAFMLMILAVQAISTVYQLSRNAGFNHQLAVLQQEKVTLNQEKNLLTQQVSYSKSITQAGLNYSAEDYLSIAKPIIISSTNNLASR